MSEAVKITQFEAENTKRIKAVIITPTKDGLTIIGGKNGQGKTSCIDGIMWGIGGNKFRPSEPHREGSMTPPMIKITLSNGLIVERKGKNSELKVIDPQGNKAGQALLDSFINELALNLPKFLESSSKDKAKTLLEIIGVGDQLYELQVAEQRLYNERHLLGQDADRKAKAAEESEFYPDAPDEPISATELIEQQQRILAINGENQRKREQVVQINRDLTTVKMRRDDLDRQIRSLANQLSEVESEEKKLLIDLETATKTAEQLKDESTEEVEASLRAIDETNVKVRANQAKASLGAEAAALKEQYSAFTDQIEEKRRDQMALLNSADLPLPELSVIDGELVYRGQQWDNMAASEQLRVATAIVRRLNPACGFVLLDKLEQLDLDTLNEFGTWAEAEGLQIIGTRVSTGSECSVIIEDGYPVTPVQYAATQDQLVEVAASWKAGEF